ncbi:MULTISPECIES: Trp biosynthesis-associated membrane protein [unclassified Luteococcus]|uniref:Trp biosynthesis-associated membrane protein n=1 Tax=unclassified Luteococcus TaxID=2639923 RepID=UPI00313B6FD5
MKPGQLKVASWLATAAAAGLALYLAKQSGAHADAAKAIGWALLAAVGVSLLLGVLGRRLVAALELALAAGLALLVARGEGHQLLALAAALGLAGAATQLGTAHRWGSAARRFDRDAAAPARPQTDLDLWKALDAGLDPTSDEIHGKVTGREDSPISKPSPGAGADQKDDQ